MRDIKFRAWCKIEKKWIQGFNLVNYHSYFNNGLNQSIYRYNSVWEDGEFELIQYIGLKDKNGKEIYEGDIVYMKSIPKLSIGAIEFNDSSFMCKNPKDNLRLYEVFCCDFDLSEIEIIGNIYENSELLKNDGKDA